MPGAGNTWQTGQRGEAAARIHLEQAGLRTLDANARYRFGELDLVMGHAQTVVFVEVRYRRGSRFGGGLGSITAQKCRRIAQAAQAWLGAHPQYTGCACRFDIVSLQGPPEAPQIHWLANAFTLDDLQV